MSTRGASLGMPGASCVLHVCAPKKFDATSENYLVVELEKEFCRAKAAEVRLTRLAEKMQRALEALRFEAATQANAREREQHQCCSCYKVVSVSAGLGCEYLLVLDGHFICASCVNCAPNEVKRIVEAIREAEPLARHKAQAGHIMCVRQDCDARHAQQGRGDRVRWDGQMR